MTAWPDAGADYDAWLREQAEAGDPVARSLLNAPPEDEELAPEEIEALARPRGEARTREEWEALRGVRLGARIPPSPLDISPPDDPPGSDIEPGVYDLLEDEP